MGREWGDGEMGSRGDGEQGRVVVQVFSPLPLCASAPGASCAPCPLALSEAVRVASRREGMPHAQ